MNNKSIKILKILKNHIWLVFMQENNLWKKLLKEI